MRSLRVAFDNRKTMATQQDHSADNLSLCNVLEDLWTQFFFLICLMNEKIFHLYFNNALYGNNIIVLIYFFIFSQTNKKLRKKQGFSSLLSLSEVYRSKRTQQMLLSHKFLFIHMYSALAGSGSPTA